MNKNDYTNPAENMVSTFEQAVKVAEHRSVVRAERQKVERIKGTCSYRVKDA